MKDHRHLIHFTVAFHTTDTAVYVHRVVKISVVRSFVELDPSNWITRVALVVFVHRCTQRFKLRRIRFHLTGPVAVPAYLRSGNIRMSRILYESVAIPTVHPELASVKTMIKRNWLLRHVSDTRILRSPRVPRNRDHTGSQRAKTKKNLDGKEVGPPWKNIAHCYWKKRPSRLGGRPHLIACENFHKRFLGDFCNFPIFSLRPTHQTRRASKKRRPEAFPLSGSYPDVTRILRPILRHTSVVGIHLQTHIVVWHRTLNRPLTLNQGDVPSITGISGTKR